MIKRSLILNLSALLFAGGIINAQSREISLSEAIKYALENKADAEKARLNIKKGDAEIKQVKANALPKVSIISNTTYNPILQEMVIPSFINPSETIKMTMGQKWISNNTLQVQQMLFNQSVFVGLKAAKTTKEFYVLNAQLTEEQIIEKVAEAYYQVYQSEQMLENLDENLKLTEQTKNIIKGLYDAGLAKKIDYDRTIVALNNVKASRQQVVNAVQLSENTLKFIIGMPMEEEISVPKDTFAPSVLVENTDSIDISERTELKVLNKQLELLNWKIEASKSNFYPTVNLQGTYSMYGQGPKMPWWNGTQHGVYWSDVSAITLNINIPIFSGFANKAKIELDKIELDTAQKTLRDTKLGLDLAYKNAKTLLKNTEITINNQQANVELANEVLSNTRNNYKFGLATLNDILDAEKDLVEAKNNLTKAKIDYKLAEVSLLKAQGKLRSLTQN